MKLPAGVLRALPWAFAAGLLSLALSRVELGSLEEALRSADWARYLALAIAFTGIWLLLDAWVIARLVTRFHAKISARCMLPLRGASYLLMAISYDAAQGALGYALHRRLGIPLFALGGTFLFYYLIDLLTIGSLGAIGAQLASAVLPRGFAIVISLFAVFIGVALGAATLLAKRGKPAPAGSRRAALAQTLRGLTPLDVLEFLGWRMLVYASFTSFAALALPAFGIQVPWWMLVTTIPVIMSVAALPITVSGIGSTQVAMLLLFGPFAEASAIVAYSLVYSATLLLLRLPIGVACLPFARDVLRGPHGPALPERRTG